MDAKAITTMPRLTIPAPQQHHQLDATQRSPFSSDNQSGATLANAGFDFGTLQFNVGGIADDKAFRESVQLALSMSNPDDGSSRNASSSSWSSQQVTTDDDGWVDEDEFVVGPVGHHTTPIDGVPLGQASVVPSTYQGVVNTSFVQMMCQGTPQAIQPSRSQPGPQANTSADAWYSQPVPIHSGPAHVGQTGQVSQIAPMPPHLLPILPFLPQQVSDHSASENICSDSNLEFEMKDLDTEIEDFLDCSFFSSSQPSSQQSMGGDAATQSGQQGDGIMDQMELNFDMSDWEASF